MAEQPKVAAPEERKVIRKETFTLSENDVFLLTQLSNTVRAAEIAAAHAQNNITNLLGIFSIERWGFAKDVDVRFSDFNLDDGKVTVEELEKSDDPKAEADSAQPSNGSESSDASSDEPASAEAESSEAEPEAADQTEEAEGTDKAEA